MSVPWVAEPEWRVPDCACTCASHLHAVERRSPGVCTEKMDAIEAARHLSLAMQVKDKAWGQRDGQDWHWADGLLISGSSGFPSPSPHLSPGPATGDTPII